MDGETHDSRLGSKKKFKFTFRGVTSLCRRPRRKQFLLPFCLFWGGVAVLQILLYFKGGETESTHTDTQ